MGYLVKCYIVLYSDLYDKNKTLLCQGLTLKGKYNPNSIFENEFKIILKFQYNVNAK